MSGVTREAQDRLARVRLPLGILAALCTLAYAWSVANAPIDRVQGVIQKILYVHPPLAYGAYLGFILTGICGALYLWKGREVHDQLAASP